MSISRSRILFTTALGHFNVDLFAAMVPILLAQLSHIFRLSNAQIGLAVLSYTASSALSQPIFGLIADRIGGRKLATVGVLWSGAWLAVAGFAPSYPVLVPALMMAGLGSGAYHPQGAVRAAVAAAAQRGYATSIFFLGGGLGFAVGPLLGGQLFASLGPRSVGLVSLISLPIAVLVWQAFEDQRSDTTPKPAPTFTRSLSWLSAAPILPLVALLVAQGMRAWISDSFNAYVPKFYLDQGLPVTQYGLITSVMLIGASAGGLIGGYLADRWNKKVIMSGALLLAAPCAYAFVHSGPETRLVFGFLAGLFVSAPFTPTLMVLQGLMPNRLTTITGLAMTYFFLAGGIGTSITGVLADRFGLPQVMNINVSILAAGALVSLLVPLSLTTTVRSAPVTRLEPQLDADDSA